MRAELSEYLGHVSDIELEKGVSFIFAYHSHKKGHNVKFF